MLATTLRVAAHSELLNRINNCPHLSGAGTKWEHFPTDDAPNECDLTNVEWLEDGDPIAEAFFPIVDATDAAYHAADVWGVRVTLTEGGAQ